LQRIARYKQLTCPEEIKIAERGDECAVQFLWLLELAQKSLTDQVKGTLKKLLAGQRPTLQDVARELRLSTRTLQRRLTAERAKFQALMEEARRELAQHYLMHSSLELNETAYLLGYEDSNSFFRAFHQWEGTSPGEWRAVHAHRANSNRASASVV
jgi:AraC-like DNA-binding protein